MRCLSDSSPFRNRSALALALMLLLCESGRAQDAQTKQVNQTPSELGLAGYAKVLCYAVALHKKEKRKEE